MKLSTEQKFNKKVIRLDDDCWKWTGSKSSGYGEFRADGKKVYVHRWSYEFYTGKKIPKYYQIDHLCRNRWCVNPSHLEPVTGAENVRRGNATKLDKEKVEEIKELVGRGHSQIRVAMLFNIDGSVVNDIINKKSWN